MNDEKIVMTLVQRIMHLKGMWWVGIFELESLGVVEEKQFQQLQPLIRVNNQNQPELRIC